MGFDLFGSTDIQKVETLSPEQLALRKSGIQYIQGGLPGGATEYTGELVAGADPFLTETYGQLTSQLKDVYGKVNEYLTGTLGKPAIEFDPGKWGREFASPMMSVWRETVAPLVAEQANLPGTFHSTHKADIVANAANQFYGQAVMPHMAEAYQMSLASQESAGARGLQQAGMIASMPSAQFSAAAQAENVMRTIQNQMLMARYQEFLRTTPEANPYLGMIPQFLQPSQEVVATQGTDYFSQLLGGGFQLGSSAILASAL